MAANYYVYIHKDVDGNAFYVGKGIGDRAWSRDRELHWLHYVDRHLNGRFDVELVATCLSEQRAIEIEAQWMARLGDALINRQNRTRGLNFEALNQSQELRADVDRLMAVALNTSIIDDRVEILAEAMQTFTVQSDIVFEKGLFGKIQRELPPIGRFDLIKALVEALLAAGDVIGAKRALDDYDRRFTGHKEHKGLVALRKRVTRVSGCGRLLPAAESSVPFNPPKDLPPDWEWANERSRAVVRLRRKLRRPGLDYLDTLASVRTLKREGRNIEAFDLLKSAIVAAERENANDDRWKIPPAYFTDAAVVAHKLGLYLEECLILFRYVHHPRAAAARIAEMTQRLNKAAAKWYESKNRNEGSGES